MVAKVRRPGSTLKLVSTWTGFLANCSGKCIWRPEYCHGRSQGRACGTPPVLRGQRHGYYGGFKRGVWTCLHTGRVCDGLDCGHYGDSKMDRVLASRWTGFDSTRERIRGIN